MLFYKSLRVWILAYLTLKAYFLSNDSTNWGSAKCNLAEPKLSYIPGSFQINETLGVHNNVSDVWIGYQQAKIPFLFISCGELNIEPTYNVTTIGFCFNLCGGRPFGIKSSRDDDIVLSESILECKCSNESLATSSHHCIPSANNLCGEKCYSIYDQLNVNESYVRNPKIANGDCLIYYYPYFRWEPCTRAGYMYNKIMCSRYTIEDVKSTALILSIMATSWVEGMALCIKEGFYPAFPRSIMNSGFNSTHSQYHWTGVIRANTLLKKSSIGDLTLYQDVHYAFLTTNNMALHFTTNGSKRSLCCSETETTSISPSTLSVQPANTSTQFSSTSIPTNVETGATKQDMQEDIHQSKQSNRDFLAIGVGIGITIGIMLALGGVVAIGCVRKRGVLHCRKTKFTEGQSTQRQEMNYEDMIDRNEINESYCVLDRNVDSNEGTVSYVNQQNDLNGIESSSNYFNTGS
ncbi:uncharacterized protein LOC127861059 isoform X2 [Dreissena polymorpha]|uniref:uncharacterized protein LOC127861059 isoform X2 n=1 Tax=Dreissena polymorpha TaxID=45954 RepID=UPI002263DB85|nr:uncharacterized protein LOC127861059 isoform X2 [Dreissena polymorpha]